MTMNQLASKIAKLEGKRSQARIGDIREILAILADLMYEECTMQDWVIDEIAVGIDITLYKSGRARAKRKKKS